MIKPNLASVTILALLLFVSHSYEQAATDIQPTTQYSLLEIIDAETTSDTRQSIFPITGVEIGGFILIMFIAGLANAGGHGGGNLLSPILIIVFNYSESNAIEVVYSLVFGASLGNFFNVFIKRDPKTEKPLIEYSVALVCMPLMLLGALFGVLLNRILATAILIIGILAVTLYSLQKTWEKAKKSYAEETLQIKQADTPLDTENNTQEILFIQTEDVSNAELQEGELKAVMEEEHQLFPKLKIGISVILILFIILIAILRGTSRFNSIIGAPYCGTEYWALLGVAVIGCCIFLLINRRIINRSLKIKELYNIVSTESKFELSKDHIGKLIILSFIAGVLAGLLGIGGGMIMNPALIGIGFPAQSLGATAGFFVVQTSLVSIFQAILYRSVPLADLGFFFAISIVGSFGVSYMLSWLVKRYKRPSLILLSLVVVLLLSLIVTPVFEILPYIGDFSTLLEFSPLCS